MKNRVYYGEYTLRSWIAQMLNKVIILPAYQRSFVWTEKQSAEFIRSLKDDQFIPPVTIGSFLHNDSRENLIVDGQQRLTSLLLAYLKLFPKRDRFEADREASAIGRSDIDTDADDDDPTPIKWTYPELLKSGNTEKQIRSAIDSDLYNTQFDPTGTDGISDLLDERTIGFSLIIPGDETPEGQQRYFARMFHDINLMGTPLIPVESRRALYYINDSLKEFFEPRFANSYTLQTGGRKAATFDFVRSAALVAAYKKSGGADTIAAYHSGLSRLEQYYEKFVYSMVSGEEEETFGKFDEIFTADYARRHDLLKETLKNADAPKVYDSIIDMDLWMLGAVYLAMVENSSVDATQRVAMKAEIDASIAEMKNNDIDGPLHQRSPSSLKYLRRRINRSIEIYLKYRKP